MTADIAVVLAVVGVALVLFWTELLAVELVGLLAIFVLVVLGVLQPDEAFDGFSQPALIMIASVLVLSASLVRNGAGERVAIRIERMSGRGPERMSFALFSCVTGISAFINNVAATAMFLPVAENLARTFRVRPSRLLMPVAYASFLGGVCTLTGTSTNVAVSGELASYGLDGIGLFELAKIGVPLAIVGVLYLVLSARWLPGRAGAEEMIPGTSRDRRRFLTELIVPEGSPATGKTLHELDLMNRFKLSPVGLIRGAVRLSDDVVDTPLAPNDVVVVEGDVRAINRGGAAAGLRRKPTTKIPPAGQGAPALVEATISYNSPLIGRTLREIDMRGRYGLDVIAIWRRGGAIVEKIGHIRLRLGDDLLIQGPLDRARRLAGDPLYLLLNDRVLPRYEPRKEWLSIGMFALAIVLTMTNVLEVEFAFLLGAIMVVLSGCLALEEAYRAINLKVILLIGSMFGVAHSLESTGAAGWLAKQMIAVLGGETAAPIWVLAGLFWMTVLLTQSMSNVAAALLVLPIGIEAASMLGVAPRPFAITVAVAASLAFMTPLEPACLLVMSTGRYRFWDFVRFGAPLTFISFVIVLLLVPAFYPF